MGEQLMEIAERLRELREICDFSMEELAEAVGVSKELYAKYESGEKDLPISVLLEVAQRCGVEPGTLWEDVPEGYTCPLCGVGKDEFAEE